MRLNSPWVGVGVGEGGWWLVGVGWVGGCGVSGWVGG